MFGPYQKVILQLIELPAAEKVLQGLVMELKDGAYTLVHEIIQTTDSDVGFKDADVCVLVGAKPRGPVRVAPSISPSRSSRPIGNRFGSCSGEKLKRLLQKSQGCKPHVITRLQFHIRGSSDPLFFI